MKQLAKKFYKEWKQLSKTSFAKKVYVLFSGGVISYFLSFVNIILFTRIYSIEDVGIYNVILSYVAIFAYITLLSYNISIQTASEKELPYLLLGSLCILLLTSSAICFGLWLFNYQFAVVIGLILLFSGLGILIDYLNIREQKLFVLSIRKCAYPFLQTIFFISCFAEIVEPTFENLITFTVAAYLLSNIIFLRDLHYHLTSNITNVRKNTLDVLKSKFKASSIISISDFLNCVAANLPTILLEKFYGPAASAFFSIASKICVIPVNIISDAIAKTYQGSVAKELRDHNKQKFSYLNFSKVHNFLFITSIFGFVCYILLLPLAIEIVLGSKWAEAAIYGQILSPTFCFLYLMSPMIPIFYLLKKVNDIFIFQLFSLLVTLFSFLFVGSIGNIYPTLLVFSFLTSIRYIWLYKRLTLHVKSNSY